MVLNLLALSAIQFDEGSTRVRTTAGMREPQPGGVRPSGALSRFRDVPGVKISYYEVAGRDIAEIHRSLTLHAPRDPITHEPIPATSAWSVTAALRSVTKGNECTIAGATLEFHASATLPLLAIDRDAPPTPEVRSVWNNYVARLEARQAAQLRFAYDRLGDVQNAIVGARCDTAGAATDVALSRIKALQLAWNSREAPSAPRLEEPQD